MHDVVLAQTNSTSDMAQAVAGLIWLVVCIAVIAGLWKTFTKAGEPGWGAIVPIYNFYLLAKIAGRPWWWLLLMLIPVVNILITLIVSVDIAKSFGKGTLFGIGLWLLGPIFYCILGFGSAEYQGPAAG